MKELLTKTKFVNALAREHIAIDERNKEFDRETQRQYLRLEVLGSIRSPSQLVIRGNRIGTYWMVLNEEFPTTLEGTRKLYKVAVDVAFAAAQKASKALNNPVDIGLPSISYFDGWLNEK